MKSFFTIILVSSIFISCDSKNEQTQNDFVDRETTIYVSTESFNGIIFKPNHQVEYKSPVFSRPILEFIGEPYKSGWIPDKETILSFNDAFVKYWEKAKTDSLAQANNLTPVLWKTIQPMDKQVIGFIDTTGQKKLWVNIGIWDEGSAESEWEKEPILVDDGGPYSYIAKYDVAQDSIYSLKSY